ncbi:MAG: 50S ribosomal protein L21 [Planctomycetota bacterium]|nr:50S ribosomal protein L21 [Planctomycetota bacterium]
MYAIFEDSGSQLKATVGAVLTVDLRDIPNDATSITFDRVLLIGKDATAKVGTPYVTGATVVADVLEREIKGEKLDIIKYKRRKGFRKKIGHRQRYMKVRVSAINGA